ncbi:hypothetical protein V9T40_010572 [Parthenolecanium corni]|uniref:Uncharacterized protein n=1 Tax=Parthenolecanium corni TaxID=536013 RepID=A0AAN9T5G4_9HEMI
MTGHTPVASALRNSFFLSTRHSRSAPKQRDEVTNLKTEIIKRRRAVCILPEFVSRGCRMRAGFFSHKFCGMGSSRRLFLID